MLLNGTLMMNYHRFTYAKIWRNLGKNRFSKKNAVPPHVDHYTDPVDIAEHFNTLHLVILIHMLTIKVLLI